jgi:hypothetical protein
MIRIGTIAGAAIAATTFVCLIGTASAAQLTGPEIKELLSGKSLYGAFTGTSTGGAGVGRDLLCDCWQRPVQDGAGSHVVRNMGNKG